MHPKLKVEKTPSTMEECRVVVETHEAWEPLEVWSRDGKVVPLATLQCSAKGPAIPHGDLRYRTGPWVDVDGLWLM